MKLVRGIHNIRAYHRGCVLTIGNFDSVHKGHQFLLKNLKLQSKNLGLPMIVMFFEPQPLEFFLGINAPARLTCLRDKIKYFIEYGVDYLLCIKFNLKFSILTPKKFVTNLLVKKLGVKFLVVGDDFRFGKNRLGDFQYLSKAGKQYNFTVSNSISICNEGKRISSTAVRQALLRNNFILAESLMGHPYRFSGRVIHGSHLGSFIGFPTANILLKCLVMPIKGVYIVEVYGLINHPLPAVANIGTRPTVNGINQQIEVHLIDVQMNIYGCYIDIVFHKKLRNEQQFSSINELKKQIKRDIIAAKNFFNLNKIFNDIKKLD
ncbi:Riboflavin biosynthesis protein RibF [Candidatus Arsenophonus lipoptenae]|uniref:Riboflavin biosynthesis protein n=1 Tax=Candidatus Arsenophonus lipoptenae TaxID=634113 RepID=A0A0X9VUL0_9GAMM|nr:bifunctional riboflavin kinase/FAD synthetase [Candidatus Arsenophonus lipoptenae]AMA64848.1 Riboflavin biosynthesis protein RibF [Candidatus Arsenophonus lipoptenae]